MGLFSSVGAGFNQINEGAHAVRLEKDWITTVNLVMQLPEDLREQCLLRMLDMQGKVAHDMRNWTQGGAIKVAKTMFEKARKTTPINLVEGYALALVAIWLESSQRDHDKARELSHKMSGMFNAIRSE